MRDIVHPGATLGWDGSRPDGTARKLLDVTRLHALGWHHAIELRTGIQRTYDWYRAHTAEARGARRP